MEMGGPDYMHWSVCVAECPMKGTKDLKWKTNEEYPSDSNKLGEWSYDTEQFMGFCFPEMAYMKEKGEQVATLMYG